MAPEESRVRILREQVVEREHVHRRLQVPQPRRAVPLQEPQHARGGTRTFRACRSRSPKPCSDGTRAEPSKCTVRKLMPMRSWHSLAVVASEWYMRLHERERFVHHREAGFGRGDTRIRVLGGGLGRRYRRTRLPEAQRAELRVGRDELTQCGRTACAAGRSRRPVPRPPALRSRDARGRCPRPGAGPTRCAPRRTRCMISPVSVRSASSFIDATRRSSPSR